MSVLTDYQLTDMLRAEMTQKGILDYLCLSLDSADESIELAAMEQLREYGRLFRGYVERPGYIVYTDTPQKYLQSL